jgi:hypothetical protein
MKSIKILIATTFVFCAHFSFSQNPIYSQNGKIASDTLFQENGFNVIYVEELDLLPKREDINPALQEEFNIFGNVTFSDFTTDELKLISSNRRKSFAVKTKINGKYITIKPIKK